MAVRRKGGTMRELTKRVYILEPWESFQDSGQLLAKCLLRILNLPDIKLFSRGITVSQLFVPATAPVHLLLMRAILKPGLIWVGSRRCVRLRTTSRNSCDVGTGAMFVHVCDAPVTTGR
jgi:hypothetical protein